MLSEHVAPYSWISCLWRFLTRKQDGIFSGQRSIRGGRWRELSVECLETRLLPSATLLSFDATVGDWESATPKDGKFEVSTIGHWDPYSLTGVVHGDFNGDGRTDVAGWSNLGYWLVGVPGNDGQLQTERWHYGWSGGWDWRAILVDDFNGDDLDDIAMFANYGAWWLARSTGSQFEMVRWDKPGDWLKGPSWKDWQSGDFNGDGLPDVAGLAVTGRWQVGLSTSEAFRAQTWLPQYSWPASSIHSVVVGDFNADGADDIAGFLGKGKSLVALSTESAFVSTSWSNLGSVSGSLSTYQRGDVDGDRKDDVIALDTNGRTWVFHSLGNAFAPKMASEWPTGYGAPAQVRVADFDSDGITEVAILTTAGVWLVGTSDGAAIRYAHWGNSETGNTPVIFASDRREPDRSSIDTQPCEPALHSTSCRLRIWNDFEKTLTISSSSLMPISTDCANTLAPSIAISTIRRWHSPWRPWSPMSLPRTGDSMIQRVGSQLRAETACRSSWPCPSWLATSIATSPHASTELPFPRQSIRKRPSSWPDSAAVRSEIMLSCSSPAKGFRCSAIRPSVWWHERRSRTFAKEIVWPVPPSYNRSIDSNRPPICKMLWQRFVPMFTLP